MSDKKISNKIYTASISSVILIILGMLCLPIL